MRLNRFMVDFEPDSKSVKLNSPEIIKQITKVLRLKPGENVAIFNGKGLEFEMRLESISKDSVLLDVVKKLEPKETKRKVSLYMSVLKKENFEFVVQKSVECGVAEIFPIVTNRTVKTGLNQTRLEKIITEATEQSGRSFSPAVFPIFNFKEAIFKAKDSDEKVIFHFDEKSYEPEKSARKISIFVGPEGGFTEEEIEYAKSQGFKVASLGENTLRGETAGIIATYRATQGI
ncbi:16S rRNA (uracil(1498)-N(3))-methyltransferase [Candidatus Nomurabacteria bacterium]|nr:16S rRNA (uracil(1498)-N(3))-methyltransferase [Candidatus Nomurabacteria bacterium]